MSLVQGEDSESDEEINTDQLTEGSLGYASGSGFPSLQSDRHKTGIVAGEESETDEEDEGTASLDQTDSSVRVQPTSSRTSSLSPRGGSPRRSSLDSTTSAPPSLLHKKLRDGNINLRRSIVERVLKIYHLTCRNLTVVNDNLSRAQGTIEKVNAHLKRSDNDLAQLNATLDKITSEAQFFAPTITTLPRQHQEDNPKASTHTPASTATSTTEVGSNSSSPSHMTSLVNYSAAKGEN